jgi:hypothetical protein|tara:strand:+ start:1531 stop:1740 length:210 start_codon:yes stop_codon:yes gene_type:complete
MFKVGDIVRGNPHYTNTTEVQQQSTALVVAIDSDLNQIYTLWWLSGPLGSTKRLYSGYQARELELVSEA